MLINAQPSLSPVTHVTHHHHHLNSSSAYVPTSICSPIPSQNIRNIPISSEVTLSRRLYKPRKHYLPPANPQQISFLYAIGLALRNTTTVPTSQLHSTSRFFKFEFACQLLGCIACWMLGCCLFAALSRVSRVLCFCLARVGDISRDLKSLLPLLLSASLHLHHLSTSLQPSNSPFQSSMALLLPWPC